jgi:hypothetical protein
MVTVSQPPSTPVISTAASRMRPERRLKTGVPDISGIRPAQAPIVLAGTVGGRHGPVKPHCRRYTDPMYRACLYLIAGWSGFFVMGIELLGGRLLAPYFGSSIYVWGAIITVFMLALAVGYLLGGQASLHRPSLKRLAAILVGAAVVTVPVLLFADGLLDHLSLLLTDPRAASLGAAGLLFFLPTMISGMVSPYAIRLLIADRLSAGHHAGKLYFVSTLGSAAGTILTSFYLVLYLEVNQILLLLLGLSALVALITWCGPAPIET